MRTLAEIRTALETTVNRIQELRGLETLTDEQRDEYGTLIGTARDLNDEIRQAQEAEEIVSGFQQARRTSRGRASSVQQTAAAEQRQEEEAAVDNRTPAQRFAESDEYRQWAERRGTQRVDVEVGGFFETRALFNTGVLPTDYVQAQRLPGIDRVADPFGSLRDVLLVGQTNAESFVFYREDVFTNNAAPVTEATATTGASGTKPESGLTFARATAGIYTIAHWLPITQQTEWAAPEMRSYIESRLLDGLRLEEDTQLLLGDGISPNMTGLLNTSNIQLLNSAYFAGAPTQNAATDAEPFDRIARARRLIADIGRSRATFVVLNPQDAEYFQTVLDGNGHYYGGGPFATGLVNTLWGLRVVINENMPAGRALVGDGRQAQIWDRMAGTISVGVINDQFIRNMRTILAEERVGLAVYRPKAFADVALYV